MARNSAILEPVMPTDQEQPAIRALASALVGDEPAAHVVTKDGASIPLPASVFRLLQDILAMMRNGLAVQLVPFHQELTTQEAAELLNVSRPYLIKLLEQGKLPYRMVGTHRRIRFGDVMVYRGQIAAEREAALEEMASISRTEGLYDRDYSILLAEQQD